MKRRNTLMPMPSRKQEAHAFPSSAHPRSRPSFGAFAVCWFCLFAFSACARPHATSDLPRAHHAQPLQTLPSDALRIALREQRWALRPALSFCPLVPPFSDRTCQIAHLRLQTSSSFLLEAKATASLRDLLALMALLPQRPSIRIAWRVCQVDPSPPSEASTTRCQPAWLPWLSPAQTESWQRALQTLQPTPSTQPCDRCARSIRRKLARIRLPPYPLPPDPNPARIVLALQPKGIAFWINERAITEGCGLWNSLLMQHPILPTLPQSTLLRDPQTLTRCLQDIRRHHPNERRILLLAPPATPLQTVVSLRDRISQIPVNPLFQEFALQALPPTQRPTQTNQRATPVRSQ